jgi:hypothetical protein
MNVLCSWGSGCLVACTDRTAWRLQGRLGGRGLMLSSSPSERDAQREAAVPPARLARAKAEAARLDTLDDVRTLLAIERASEHLASVSEVAPPYLQVSGRDPLQHIR